MIKTVGEYFGYGRILTPDMRNEYVEYVRKNIAVGDGLTSYTRYGRHAYTVIKKTAWTVTLQRDKAVLDPNFVPEWTENGFCQNSNRQSYTYERDPDGEIIVAHWSKKAGFYHHKYFDTFVVGRHEYYDYSFWGPRAVLMRKFGERGNSYD